LGKICCNPHKRSYRSNKAHQVIPLIISLVASMARNRVIGRNNKMPWHLPTDLGWFRDITMGHSLIMGRKTFESIGHPLPGRRTIVISSQRGFSAAGCVVARDLRSAIALCEAADEVFICGGEAVFREAMALADRIYLTVIDKAFDGDAFFPEIPDDFIERERRSYKDVLPYDRVRYERHGAR
jgi:dihydrofolate reductase